MKERRIILFITAVIHACLYVFTIVEINLTQWLTL